MGGVKDNFPVNSDGIIMAFVFGISSSAVGIFLLLTGYLSWNKDRFDYWKPFSLLLEVILVNGMFYIFKIITGDLQIGFKNLLLELFPSNYYVILYCTLFVFMPLLNSALQNISRTNMKKLIIIMMVVLSLYPTLIDTYEWFIRGTTMNYSTISRWGSGWGYTAINFMFLYLIGAYIGKYERKYDSKRLFTALIICDCVIAGWIMANAWTGWSIIKSAISYCNPLVISCAVAIFLIFRNIKDKGGNSHRVVSGLAKITFMMYLVHPFVLEYIELEYAVSNGWIVGVSRFALSLVISILISIAVYFVWILLDRTLIKQFRKLVKFKVAFKD